MIDNTQTTLYPGGILNTGFALSWAKDRVHDAKPASKTGGQPWALKRIQGGDKICKANQALHAEAVDLLAKVARQRPLRAEGRRPARRPSTFVHKINVPVYLACQFTDEQTGGHCPTLPRHFTGTKRKWFTFTNGVHTDSLDPATFNRWYDFLELYVAQRNAAAAERRPRPSRRRSSSRVIGIDGVTLPDDPIQSQPSYEAALAAFQALPSVRILFDNGAGAAARRPGAGLRALVRRASRCPAPPRARGTSAPAARSPTPRRPRRATDTFTWSRAARPPTTSPATRGGTNGLWTATPSYKWSQNPPGTAASYVSAPLAADTGVVGAGALEAWIKSPARSVDLQATVTEVRPDGQETFVQSGWLRASERKLDAQQSTLLEPVLSLRKKDSKRAAEGQVHQGHRAALLPGPRLPGGLTRARDAGRAARRPADLGVRGHAAEQGHEGDDRARSRRGRRGSCCRSSPGSTRRPTCRRARACAASPAARSPSRRGSSERPPRAPRRPSRAARRGARARPRT